MEQQRQQQRPKKDDMETVDVKVPSMSVAEAKSLLAPMIALVKRFQHLDEVLVAVEVAEGRMEGLTQQVKDAEAALANLKKRHADDVAAHAAWQQAIAEEKDTTQAAHVAWKEAMGMERTQMQQAMREKP